MLEWSKHKVNRIISYFFFFIFLASFAFALDDCSEVTYIEDVPCLILLPYTSDCTGLTVSVYNKSTLLYTQTMANYTSANKCNATFNQTGFGTYSLVYSTGDTGTIVVDEGYARLYTYISMFILLALLIIVGYYYENPHIHFLAGLMFPIMALDIFFNGFPQVTGEFMTNSIAILLTGIGMYYLIAPYIIFYEKVGI